MKRKDSWKPEADARLIELRHSHGKTWEQIGLILGRSDKACRRRYDKTTTNETRRKIYCKTWSEEEEAKLYRLVHVEKKKRSEVSVIMGRTRGSIDAKVEQMRAAAERVYFERPRTRIIPKSVLEDRDRRMSAPDRSFGDPAPGQSALDRMRATA